MTDKLARPHLRKLTEHNRPASGTPAGGNGWGSPPNAPKAFSADYQPSAESKTLGHATAKTATDMAKVHLVAAIEVWREVMMDPTHSMRVVAATKMVERAAGTAPQSIDMTLKHSGNIGNTPEALLLDMLTTEELEILHQLRLSAEERATEGQEP